MKPIDELSDKVACVNKILTNNPNIKLLYTQKKAVRFLIASINNRDKQLRKSLKEIMLELLKDGYLNKLMVNGSEDEIRAIINEISSKISNDNISPANISNSEWQIHKPTAIQSNEITDYINDIAKLVIELGYFPQKLSLLLDRLDKIPAITFDEEIEKIFAETGVLLIEKCDVDPNESNEKGVTVKNIRYNDDWELFLWWAISKANFCRCILHSSPNNFSIIGLEDNVNKVVELYQSKSKEIQDNSIEKAKRKKLLSLTLLKNPTQEQLSKIKNEEKQNVESIILIDVKNLLSNIFLASKDIMRVNEDGINYITNEKFPNLRHTVFLQFSVIEE